MIRRNVYNKHNATVQFREEGGILATASSLHKVVIEQKGGSEELLVVFVAMLRASGILVRFVRSVQFLLGTQIFGLSFS